MSEEGKANLSTGYSKEEASDYIDHQVVKFVDGEWRVLMECYDLNEQQAYNLILDSMEKYISNDIPLKDELLQITKDLKDKFTSPGPLTSLERAKLAKEHFEDFFSKLYILNRESGTLDI